MNDSQERFAVIFIAIIIIFVSQIALANDKKEYNISKSWFKPSLTVNNDPAICGPLLDGYIRYFTSSTDVDPFKADFQGDRMRASSSGKLTTNSIETIGKVLQEVEWKSYNGKHATFNPDYVAETNVNGHYFAIARNYYYRGSNELHEDILITTPLSVYLPLKDNENILQNEFLKLVPQNDGTFLRVVDQNDSSSKDHDPIEVEIANFYSAKDELYLLLRTYNPQPDNYLLVKILDEERFVLACSIHTDPKEAKLEEQMNKMPIFKAFKNDLLVMMGQEGNCGSLHALYRAESSMTNALNGLLYRPWNYTVPSDNSSWTDSIYKTTSHFEMWGYSGIWNFVQYRRYLSHRTIVEAELEDFFSINFSLSKSEAADLASDVIKHVIVTGFDHGSLTDRNHDLHKRILEGSIGNKLIEEEIEKEEDDSLNDSILTFATEHPDLLSILLKKGFDPNRSNAFGKTPLMYAAQFDAVESAKLLLENGANTEATTIESTDTCSYVIRTTNVSALHYAVRYASADFIKLMLEYGAPTFFRDSNGNTPYDYLKVYGFHSAQTQQIFLDNQQEQNKKLSEADFEWLLTALKPPEESKMESLSKEINLKAEKLYGEGQLQEAYKSLKRATSLNPNNGRALSNLSLVALKLDMLGESSKASTRVIETAHSESERANAHFNLGLVCKKVGMTGFHYDTIHYDGKKYCDNSTYIVSNSKREDTSALPNFLAAYKLKPTNERLATILSFVQDADPANKKMVWTFPENGSGIKSLYISGENLYFLIDESKDVPFKNIAYRYQEKDHSLQINDSDVIPLTNGLKLVRWDVGQIDGSLLLDNLICSQTFPVAFDATTKLVEIFSSDNVRILEQDLSQPTILLFYGQDIEWTIKGDLSNIVGVYIHGQSKLNLSSRSDIPVFNDNEKVKFDPKDTSFNRYVGNIIGLPVYSIIKADQEGKIMLTDDLVEKNRLPLLKSR